MPAAAVIPAPVAYINTVAVKRLVVGFLEIFFGAMCLVHIELHKFSSFWKLFLLLIELVLNSRSFTVS